MGRIPTAGNGTTTEGEHTTPQPGATIEYGVPLSGTGAPANMSESQTANWGQKDHPEYATAIFPPDEPQTWPASATTRAITYYMDYRARTVNIATPSGAITTTEYDKVNNVTRVLSADNRAQALKEGKTAEAAELLDTKSIYNEHETELTESLGPQHLVKLVKGKDGGPEEVLARNHIKYFYDENAPENGETYQLVTKSTDGARTASGEEFDIRTDSTSYGGQHGLGWTLRMPTSTTTDPAGLDLTHTTEYGEQGNVTETKAPEATAEVVYPPVFNKDFGSAGAGSDEFNHPQGLVGDAGKVIAVDQGNDRIEEFKTSGAFISAYGSAGTGDIEFSAPFGVAVDPVTGQLYISDSGNNRIQVVTAAGVFVEAIGWGVKDGKEALETCTTGCKAGLAGSGSGQFHDPTGLTFNSAGDLWVTDTGNNRVEEISPEGTYMSQFGTKGSGNGQLSEPVGIAMDEGQFYVVDYGNDRVEEFSSSGAYLAQFGSKGSGERQFNYPVSIVANMTSGDLYVSDTGNSRIQEWTPAGKFLTEIGSYGTEAGELSYPTGVALEGKLYVADQDNNRLSVWNAQPEGGARMNYANQFGSAGSGTGQFSYPIGDAIDGHGNVWVSDYDNNRIQEFSAAGKFLHAYGTHGSGHGQFAGPSGIAVNQSTGDVYVGDCGNHRVEELDEKGEYVTAFGSAGSEPGEMGCPEGVKIDSSGHVWVVDGEHDRIEEYSATGTFIATYGKVGSEEGEFDDPTDLAFSGGDVYVADTGNHRVEELSATTGEFLGEFGKEGGGDGEFYEPTEIAADPAGNLYVVDSSNGRVQEFNAAGTFLARFASQGAGEGQLSGPLGIAINAAGSMYVVDSGNNRVEQWMPVNQAAHETKTVYYTAKEEAEVTACRNHPEWVNLPCQTSVVGQPNTPELPELPTSTITYNMWDQTEADEEKFGSEPGSPTRTRKNTFDSAGRPLTSEVISSTDTSLPTVTDTYNTTNGTLQKQSTTVKEVTKTITSKYNARGELEEYTDADGNTTTYTYSNDGQITATKDAKGEQKYVYEKTTGFLSELVDSKAKAFTAENDVEGNLVTEHYPNAMTATYTRNAAGERTGIEYKKTSDCKSACPETWFKETRVPSIHGEILNRANTATQDEYAYDNAGRLISVEETPAGGGCTTRLYAYNEESDRTSLTTRPPGTEGKCAGEAGTIERHIYDSGNRLTDPGIKYETFGNVTLLPAADAGGPEGGSELTSEYYVDNQLEKQTQNKKTSEYKLDPEGRTRETLTTGHAALISHYDGPGSALAWTGESSEKWTRYIPGIGGELTAIQTGETTPILQLHDLQGDIVATVGDSEKETEPLTKYTSTEFGVPTTSNPPSYSWFGADGVASELSSGDIAQDGETYVPLIGRQLQTQGAAPILPQNVINPYTVHQAAWVAEIAGERGQLAVAEAEQAKKAQEEAEYWENHQEPTSGCDEADEGCGPDPEHGTNSAYCSVWVSWGGTWNNSLNVHGHAFCVRPEIMYMQIALLRKLKNGKYAMYEKPSNGKFNNANENSWDEMEHTWTCEDGTTFQAWVWGAYKFAGGPFVWSASAEDGHTEECEALIAEEPVGPIR